MKAQASRKLAVRRSPRAPVRVLDREVIYRGKVFGVERHRVREPGGIVAVRELVVHAGSVVLLPRLADGRILLVRQYRHPVGRTLWELVAGRIEPGETPRQAAERELVEETGYRAGRLRRLLEFYPSPGLLSERMIVFLAEQLRRGPAQPEADEKLLCRAFAPRELRQAIRRNRLRDGKTIAALLYYFFLCSGRRVP